MCGDETGVVHYNPEAVSPYTAVDLGLSVKWADMNVGAAKPEDYGDYFAWGETAPRGADWATEAPYDWAHAPFNNGSSTFDSAYFNAHRSEWLDGDALKPEYDAAHVIMGGSWRMPTQAEMQELINGTTKTVKELNGILGMRLTALNGNSIFIPFGGMRHLSGVYSVNDGGQAWSSSIDVERAGFSHYLDVGIDWFASVEDEFHYIGFTVRGVC